jgi:hypothetical protein
MRVCVPKIMKSQSNKSSASGDGALWALKIRTRPFFFRAGRLTGYYKFSNAGQGGEN